MTSKDMPDSLIAEAKQNPGGWVYEIVGQFGPDDAVPPSAIKGAWKVNDDGEIVGDLQPNPNFQPHGAQESSVDRKRWGFKRGR